MSKFYPISLRSMGVIKMLELANVLFQGVISVGIIFIVIMIKRWSDRQRTTIETLLPRLERKLDALNRKENEGMQTDWDSLSRAKQRLADMGYRVSISEQDSC